MCLSIDLPCRCPSMIPIHVSVHAITSPLLSCSQLVMVTEPVFASVANVLSGFDGIPSIQSVRLSELEVKHGITQVQHCRASHRQHAQLHHSSTALALRSDFGLTSLQSPSGPTCPPAGQPFVALVHLMACPPAVMKYLCRTNNLHRCHTAACQLGSLWDCKATILCLSDPLGVCACRLQRACSSCTLMPIWCTASCAQRLWC